MDGFVTAFVLVCVQYKLCKVKKIIIGTKGIPHLITHDARTIRYPDPLIKVNDTVRIDLESSKITDFIKFDTGAFPAAAPRPPGRVLVPRACVLTDAVPLRQHVHGDRRR